MTTTSGNLTGKTAVVTGASSGNGRAIALALAKAGANVVCSDLSPEARSTGYDDNINIPTHEEIQRLGGQSTFYTCDTTKNNQIQSLIKHAVTQYGHLDIMVNNAGIFTGMKTILEETEEDFDRTMAVNTRGVYFGCKFAIQQFIAQQENKKSLVNGDGGKEDIGHSLGKIINIASIGGLVGLATEPAYCASKAAVVNLTRQLAIDFGPKRINVNALCPGFLVTAMIRPIMEDPAKKEKLMETSPWPRLGNVGDVASAVLFLAGRESDWMTGSALTLDGGFTAR